MHRNDHKEIQQSKPNIQRKFSIRAVRGAKENKCGVFKKTNCKEV